MYVHIGGDRVISDKDIIGIFDMDNTTVSKNTRKNATSLMLEKAQREGRVETVMDDIPKSFVVTENKVYITQLSVQTIIRRINNEELT
ncbi:MAG: DUF370 domain-containing protein [Clostridia bacterium]|nr:DUF370 domain-containing protein [Clostridia bacterium]MBR3870335.1 DUF370 domain-containing protein [Clostridia bacterium]